VKKKAYRAQQKYYIFNYGRISAFIISLLEYSLLDKNARREINTEFLRKEDLQHSQNV
jgi:hypothetical protein